MVSKVCSKCKEDKLFEHFHSMIKGRDCLQSRCKVCSSISSRDFYRNRSVESKQVVKRKVKLRLEHSSDSKARAHFQMMRHRGRKLGNYSKLSENYEAQFIAIYKESIELTKKTGVLHEVDHIIPLKHNLVSGLCVPWNMQIITDAENIVKMDSWDGTQENTFWKIKMKATIDLLKKVYK